MCHPREDWVGTFQLQTQLLGLESSIQIKAPSLIPNDGVAPSTCGSSLIWIQIFSQEFSLVWMYALWIKQ